MKKPQDSDIFGTKADRIVPRIRNDEKVDPNSAFQSRMDAQYELYSRTVNPRKNNSLI